MIECTNCGFANADATQFCVNCGHFLAWTGEEVLSPATSKAGTPASTTAPSSIESPVIVVEPTRLRLEAGRSSSLTVRVSNRTATPERFVIGVAGETSKWARVDPRIVSVYPGSDETVVVTFDSPRETALSAGDYEVRIGAESEARGSTVVWSTATLEIAAFEDLWADLVPPAAVGALSGRYRVRLTNGGNTPVAATISAGAEGLPLRVTLAPPSLTIDSGHSSDVSLNVRARRIRWLGSDRMPLSVRVATGASERTLVGMFEHRGVFAGSPSISSLVALGTGAGLGIVALTAGVLR